METWNGMFGLSLERVGESPSIVSKFVAIGVPGATENIRKLKIK